MNYPSIFQASHFGDKSLSAKGSYQAVRGKGALNYLAWLFVKVPVGEFAQPFTLRISKGEKYDVWERDFNGSKFITRLIQNEGVFTESRGPFSFEFKIEVISTSEVIYKFQRFRFFGILIPRWCSVRPEAKFIQISSTQWQFDVVTRSPINSLVVRYWGNASVE